MNDFNIGDVILITMAWRRGEETRIAQVTDVDYNGLGLVNYAGVASKKFLPTGSGAFNPPKIGSTPFGIVKVEKVDHYNYLRPTYSWSPKPGDRGYDLMG